MKNNVSFHKIILFIILLTIIQFSCSLISGNSQTSVSEKLPNYGVFIINGDSYIEVPYSKGMPASKNDSSIPNIENKQPEIVIWFKDIKLEYLYMREMGLVGDEVNYKVSPIEDDIYQIILSSPLELGVYCLIQGDPLGSPYSLPTWCFRVEISESSALESDLVPTPTSIPFDYQQIATQDIFGVYMEWNPNEQQLFVIKEHYGDNIIYNLATNQIIELPRRKNISSAKWSPDGKILAIVEKSNIDLLDVNNLEILYSLEYKIPELPGILISDIEWKPDSKMLAASYSNGDILIWDISSGKVNDKLLSKKGISFIDWHPIENKLALVNNQVDNELLQIIDISTSTIILEKKISDWDPVSSYVRQLEWNPNGIELAFEFIGQVVIFNHISEEFLLLDADDGGSGHPDLFWNSDGNVILFGSYSGFNFWTKDGILIGRMNSPYNPYFAWSTDGILATTSPQEKLTFWDIKIGLDQENDTTIPDSGMSVSDYPVGIYHEDKAGVFNLYVEYSDGNRIHIEDNVFTSQVSKDCNQIVYDRINNTDEVIDLNSASLYSVSIDGSNKQNLTQDLDSGFSPALSPDGKMVAFSSGEKLWVLNMDSGESQAVEIPDAGGIWQVQWSPGGEYISFVLSTESDNFGVVKLDGYIYQKLTIDFNNPTITTYYWSLEEKIVFPITIEPSLGRWFSVNPDGTHLNDITGSTINYEERMRCGWPITSLILEEY